MSLRLLTRLYACCFYFFFSSRRRHTRWPRDWSSDVCSFQRAKELRRPLVGNVVHTTLTNRDDDHGRRIIRKLREQGWFVTHELWSLTIDTGTEEYELGTPLP